MCPHSFIRLGSLHFPELRRTFGTVPVSEPFNHVIDIVGHCVIVVAEGAGAEHFDGIDLGQDPSGNKRLPDIGTLLKDRTKAFWAAKGRPIEVRLIDPSYQVRLGPAIVSDECMHMCLHA